ncbi:MAG: NAD(P)H-dependent glycerol-3-phosphate dehydrogenase [Betaproteobacteria bacterium]
MKITVLGAGAWGTALALQAAPRHEVLLWARNAQQAALMQRERCNARYLPGVPLPPALSITHDLDRALAHGRSGLTVVGTPMSGLRSMLQAVDAQAPVVWLCKGLEADTGLIGHELAAQVRPSGRHGVLSGPSFAAEVARAQPTALVAASHDADVLERAVSAFHADALRVYTSTDPVGVEVGGAVKNVMAIATGVCDGLGLGLNARAALITRGLAEITRLGLALGAKAETFMGLSGLGDLVLTATGDLSRNRRVGLALARGQQPSEILAELGHVSEGVYSARTIAQRAQSLGVAMPITEAVVGLLEGRLTPAQGVQQLLQREAKAEG